MRVLPPHHNIYGSVIAMWMNVIGMIVVWINVIYVSVCFYPTFISMLRVSGDMYLTPFLCLCLGGCYFASKLQLDHEDDARGEA